jgi:putative flippase GtrA
MSNTIYNKLLDPRFVKFLIVGLINTIFGYAVYASLIYINLSYLTALLLATVLGVLFNYFTFGRGVFSSQGNWSVFGKFLIAYTVVYVVNALALSILTTKLHLSPYLGQLICLPLSVVLSWLLMNHWVYKKKDGANA